MEQDKFKKLVLNHAAAMKEFKCLKDLGKEESCKCPHYPSCISRAHTEMFSLNSEAMPDDGYSFEETFDNLENPPACEHCRNVLRLKKERGVVGRRLGSIRAAMTRVANREIENEPKALLLAEARTNS